jgi:ATP-dependent DNA helicase PIF1
MSLKRPDPSLFSYENTAPEIIPDPDMLYGIPDDGEPITHRPGEYLGISREAFPALPVQDHVAFGADTPQYKADVLHGEATVQAPVVLIDAMIEPPPPVVYDEKQQAAISAALSSPYTDISGTAGVGKTFVAREILRQYEELHGPGSCVLAATTGIAAVNLGEGTTINALLKYFDTAALRANYTAGHTQSVIRKLRRIGVRRILLDEKSMLSGEQFGYIVKAIREVNDGEIVSLESIGNDDGYESLTAQEERNLPPIGLTLVGDFGQLPPVPDTQVDPKNPSRVVKMPVTFCFDSPQWGVPPDAKDDPSKWTLFAANRTVLDRIYRQDASDFIAALHAVRRGDVRSALEFFTPEKFSQGMNETFDGTTIFPKNDMVERYNLDRLERLTTPSLTYPTTREGQLRADWKQIPESLRLKEGALVMILANRRTAGDEDEPGRMIYANGDLGILQGGGERGWWVKLHRTGGSVCVFPVDRQNLIPLEPGRRKELKEQGIAESAIVDNKFESIGRVVYMPLRAAYGCTVHKTQGLTLDNVQVNINDSFMKQPGMLFVALSRARTAEGLRIVGSQRGFIERCTVERRVQPWL